MDARVEFFVTLLQQNFNNESFCRGTEREKLIHMDQVAREMVKLTNSEFFTQAAKVSKGSVN